MEILWFMLLVVALIWGVRWLVKRAGGWGNGWTDRGQSGPGPGWGRGPGPQPVKPRGPSYDPDGLLEVPYEWIEAHGKWAKKLVQERRKSDIEAK